MKILIITWYFPPDSSIASQRPYSWAKYWSRMGYSVDVLTTKKTKKYAADNVAKDNYVLHDIDFPNLYKRIFGLHSRLTNEKAEELEQKSSSSFAISAYIKKKLIKLDKVRKSRGMSVTCRMPSIEDIWALPAIRWARQQEPWDLVVSTQGPYVTHLIAYFLRKKGLAKKWVADYRDLWVDHHIYKGLWPFTIIEKMLERLVNNSADCLITVSEPLAIILQKKYGKETIVIENGFDLEEFQNISKEPIFTENKKLRIVYTGTIYQGFQDPTPLFRAISSIDEKHLNNIEVLFFGKNVGNLLSLIKNYELEEVVRYMGMISRQDSLRVQRDADVLLFLEWEGDCQEGVFTSKIFEYAMSGSPILSIGSNPKSVSSTFILNNKLGVVLENDINRIRAYLEHALITKESSIKTATIVKGKELKNFSRKYLAEKMISKIL